MFPVLFYEHFCILASTNHTQRKEVQSFNIASVVTSEPSIVISLAFEVGSEHIFVCNSKKRTTTDLSVIALQVIRTWILSVLC